MITAGKDDTLVIDGGHRLGCSLIVLGEEGRVRRTAERLGLTFTLRNRGRRRKDDYRLFLPRCSMSNDYEKYITDPDSPWHDVRRVVLNRAGGNCECCGRRARLSVHHLNYERLYHENPTEDLQALCDACHEKADEERKQARARGLILYRNLPGGQSEEGNTQPHPAFTDVDRKVLMVFAIGAAVCGVLIFLIGWLASVLSILSPLGMLILIGTSLAICVGVFVYSIFSE